MGALNTVLERMHSEKVPFILMPAAEAIYRPYDFRYIYDQCMQEVKKMRQQMLEIVKVSRRKKERLNFQMRDCGTQKRWQIFCYFFGIRGKYMLSEIQPIIRR